ncbi:MAG: hypothetical protein U1E70_21175 [Acetobacteraceae bacterium]|nr:hypothetical protein [Pseudomonadota bacterium]
MNRLSTPELTVLRKTSQVSAEAVPAPAEERAVAPAHIGIGAVGRHHPSFVQLYYAIEARRSNAMPLVIQFIAPAAGAGASLVAAGYARVAADDSPHPVLFVDCNGIVTKSRRRERPSPTPTLFDVLRRGLPLSDAVSSVPDAENLVCARLGPGERPLLAFGGDRFRTMLDMLRTTYPVIVLDTPPTVAPESAAVARYCDGSVLVVAAGRTRQWEIENARALLERLGGQTVGVVLNRERALLPRWLAR